MAPLRWFFGNLSTLLLAFALAVVVWFSAETAANPNIERERSVPLEVIGLAPDMLIVGNIPTQARLTLRAPTTVMDGLSSVEGSAQAWVDITGLGPGTHELEVKHQVSTAYGPVRVNQVTPAFVTLTLEPLTRRNFRVELEVSGEPAIGYQKGPPVVSPNLVTVSGPASNVEQINDVRASLDVAGATETVKANVPVLVVDEQGQPVEGVNITPGTVEATQPIFLQGGFRNVIIKVVTSGQPADGYKLTNITVSPLNAVVFSTDPQLVNDLPGYIETEPVDLDGAEDDVDSLAALVVPDGVSVVGDDRVLVRVSIAAIEGSQRLLLPIVPLGLPPSQAAQISPESVEVLLAGPVPLLTGLQADDIRVSVDLSGLDLGIYQLSPQVDVLPERLSVDAIVPSTVQVSIIPAPTATPTREVPVGTIPPSPSPTTTPAP